MSRQVNKTLQNINLGENRIGAVGTTAIAEALKVRAACLGARFASLLAIFHVHLALFPPLVPPVTTLQSVHFWLLLLQVNKSVTEINLNWNDIGRAGAASIAEALKVLCVFSAHLCTEPMCTPPFVSVS